ncbi:MAG: 6-hydroxymethylpterin diphosphokinase MptE-like protein [bacterium]
MRLLQANVAELPSALARAIERADHRPDEVVVNARDGSPVNGIGRARRPALFHSGYAPLREADRLADTAGNAGCAVVLGMGMAYHIRAISRRGCRVLLVEPDLRLLRSALERVDLTDLLRSGSLTITDPDDLDRAIPARYVPAVHGDLSVVELPGRVSAEPDAFVPLRDAVGRVVERLRSDLAVQAKFGLRWMRNTILNVPDAHAVPLPTWEGRPVRVAAAGPSLADSIPELAAASSSALVAVDTALPVLLAHGVRPDLVVSIDCQLPTYHHYLTAGFPRIPVAAELSLPPSLFARFAVSHPLRSDHPLHTLLRLLGLDLPYLDARGGNVTQAAVDLVSRLGAAEVGVYGADFSYPDGETYPRASYVHRLFDANASRLMPASTRHYAFLLGRPGVRRDEDEPTRWVQPLLSGYAEAFGAFTASLPTRVTRVAGRGIPVARHEASPSATAHGAKHVAISRSPPARDILRSLRAAIHEVSQPSVFIRAVGHPREETLAAAARALLPTLTYLRATGEPLPVDALLSRVRGFADRYVDAALERCDGE